MGKYGTRYFEDERILSDIKLDRFGINPFATKILIDSYKNKVAPQPATIIYDVGFQDKNMDEKTKDKHRVEISLKTPGFVGKLQPPRGGLDKLGLKLFARSYYENVRPQHISFLYDGIEVHVRTPGIEEGSQKNIARDIFNPTK